jgi:hypothetical protein
MKNILLETLNAQVSVEERKELFSNVVCTFKWTVVWQLSLHFDVSVDATVVFETNRNEYEFITDVFSPYSGSTRAST